MNSRQLQYFDAVLREGGFSAASRALHIAQPALSGHIAALEAELGLKLFERTNKGVTPTSAGIRLGEHAQSILRQIDSARLEMIGNDDSPSGEVLVALPLTAAYLLAAPMHQKVSMELPRIKLRIVEGLSFESGDVMSSGRGDLGLVPNAADIPNLEAMSLFQENLYLVGKWDGVSPRLGEIPLAKLPDFPLIQTQKRVVLRRAIEELAAAEGITLNTAYEITGLHVLYSLLEGGLGYTVMNWALIGSRWDLDRLAAWKIVDPEAKRTISLTWPKNRPMTAAVKAVRKVLIGVLRDVVADGRWPATPMALYDDEWL
ncbi:LysR family transcriptional regulator [Martelella mediterranea]|uniref:LysR family transcriptional regulator n=1 Tax=Martelella mediterranea TaxID=293089 RepID=UPI001E410BE8|nr:LysR substrate-binding domain-containing protein [Martelella mediterranea]MCD1634929.1 LysR family transcriptional regulator [Martelella mediterranea]